MTRLFRLFRRSKSAMRRDELASPDGNIAVNLSRVVLRRALPRRVNVRPVRAAVALFEIHQGREVPAPCALAARDAGQVLEHGFVERQKGRLIERLPPTAAATPSRCFLWLGAA